MCLLRKKLNGNHFIKMLFKILIIKNYKKKEKDSKKIVLPCPILQDGGKKPEKSDTKGEKPKAKKG